jgi:hypothetical protein
MFISFLTGRRLVNHPCGPARAGREKNYFLPGSELEIEAALAVFQNQAGRWFLKTSGRKNSLWWVKTPWHLRRLRT